MTQSSTLSPPEYGNLPNLSFRQLEVFFNVFREGSYANAAVELRSTRSNIKRLCKDFENEMGRPLFIEKADRTLDPTPFARGLMGQTTSLSRALRHLEDGVKSMHEKGRVLRFGGSGDFFRGGVFTSFLARLQISDAFRPCFLRIETQRFRTALLNSECDVFFGTGISASERLELVDLGPIPWKFEKGLLNRGKMPAVPSDLPPGRWWVAVTGEKEAAEEVLQALHAAGAKGGALLGESEPPPSDGWLLRHDPSALTMSTTKDWPCYRFCAVLKKHHPYSELMPRLVGAAAL